MPISIETRKKIKDFINNQQNVCSFTCRTDGGPCADWVAGIIEGATGLEIQDKKGVFNKNIYELNNAVLIPDYQTFMQVVEDGDVLYITHENGATVHYMLFCNVVQDNQECVSPKCLGVNGGQDLKSIPYKNIIAAEIIQSSFTNDGYFRYTKDNHPFLLYKVNYDLG